MRRGFSVLMGVVTLAGCIDSTVDLHVPVASPTSPATSAPSTSSPTPVPADFGDGHDGPLPTPSGTVIVNVCRAVVAGSGSSIEVASATGLGAGQRILIHQVQVDFAAVADMNPVTLTTMSAAGTYEITRIDSIAGSVLTVSTALVATFTSAGTARAQVCTLPEYTTATIPAGALLRAPPWDGATGGVVGFFATGVVVVDGRIDADWRGFRGGSPSVNGFAPDTTTETTANDHGGGRGEGLDGRALGANGRGNRANAAGGGNDHCAGGGGGGNAGAGGYGGMQGEGNTQLMATRGRPGSAVSVSAAYRLIFGGGAGGGHQDNSSGTEGGWGGGAVLVFAQDLRGTGVIRSDGATAADAAPASSDRDGAGGGGAGGTIVIRASSSTFSGILSASGGDGGYTGQNVGNGAGPGGGGGGGRVFAPAFVTSAGTVVVGGGVSGLLDSTDPFGATDGAPGVVEN